MAQRGRPPVLDEDKKKTIIKIISQGCSRQSAALHVGCNVDTIRNTAKRDPVFADKLLEAGQQAEVGLLENIRQAAKKEQYWRAAAWTLERTIPDRYAARAPNVVTAEQQSNLMRLLGQLVADTIPAAKYRQSVIRCVDKMLHTLQQTEPKAFEPKTQAKGDPANVSAIVPATDSSVGAADER